MRPHQRRSMSDRRVGIRRPPLRGNLILPGRNGRHNVGGGVLSHLRPAVRGGGPRPSEPGVARESARTATAGCPRGGAAAFATSASAAPIEPARACRPTRDHGDGVWASWGSRPSTPKFGSPVTGRQASTAGPAGRPTPAAFPDVTRQYPPALAVHCTALVEYRTC